MNHIFAFSYVQSKFLALGARFGQVVIAQGRLSWLPEVAIWEIFEILGGAGDI